MKKTTKKTMKKTTKKTAKKTSHISPGTYVIARSRDAGVWCGTLEAVDFANATVTLTGARQMWFWKTAESITLLSAAERGVSPAECQFSVPAKRCTMLGCCALVEVSSVARTTLEAANAQRTS